MTAIALRKLKIVQEEAKCATFAELPLRFYQLLS
jgi:hypothetical protein